MSVARSASGLGAVLALLALCGCTTTQEVAARLRLNGARLRASQVSVRVRASDPDIQVQRVSIVSGHGGSAVLVQMRNLAGHVVSDLPISVGVIGRKGNRVYLNGGDTLNYFQAHLPGIAPRGELTWVFTTSARLDPSAHAFAAVGPTAAVPLPQQLTLPGLVVTGETLSRMPRGVLRVRVHNPTSIPQYQLEVYAFSQRGDRYAAAGEAMLAHLGSNSSAEVPLKLLGSPTSATVALEAPPTIFG
jgi:hypothetical protein